MVSATAGPALTTRRTKTEFNLRAGETFVLSGLLQRSTSTDIEKVPLLGDLPVLGALFRSKRFQNKETELVVFVTPTLVDAKSPGMVDKVQKTTERLQETMGTATPYLTQPLQPGQDMARLGSVGAPALSTTSAAAVLGIGSNTPNAAATPSAQQAAVAASGASAPEVAASAPSSPATSAAADKRLLQGVGAMAKVVRDGLVLHSRPNLRSDTLLELGVGSYVELGDSLGRMEGSNVWRQVVVGALRGWVLETGLEPWHANASELVSDSSTSSSRYAKPDQSALGKSASAEGAVNNDPRNITPNHTETGQRYRVALVRLALRLTPDVNAPAAAQLSEGDVVTRLAEPARGYWVAVQSKGQRGWVAAQWLQPMADAAVQ